MMPRTKLKKKVNKSSIGNLTLFLRFSRFIYRNFVWVLQSLLVVEFFCKAFNITMGCHIYFNGKRREACKISKSTSYLNNSTKRKRRFNPNNRGN